MRGLIASYERNYLRVVVGLGVVVLLSLTFFLGYAKGSPRSLEEIVAKLAKEGTAVLQAAWHQNATGEPKHFLQPARGPGDGVTINRVGGRDDLVLLTGFFDGNPGLKLIRRDGTTVAQWTARVYDLLSEQADQASFPKSNWNIDLHGSYLEPDGSVLFNFEYQALVKLTRCGDVVWTLPARTHHTVEPAAAGGYWVGGRRVSQRANDPSYYPVVSSDRSSGRIADDLVLRVDQKGKIVEAKSLFDILMDNGFEPVLTATGMSLDDTTLEDNEVLHMNKIVELSADLAPAFPDFSTGDLLISVRDYNLVLVVEPGTWRVKWQSVGPWIRQHNARFMSDGTISVFNNNVYGFQSGPDGVTDLTQPRETNILAVHPRSGKTRVLYGDRPGQEMLSVFRGYHHEMPDGGLLITEPEAGRVFEVDGNGQIVWEYINRWDETRVIEMTGARAFPADYFTVRDWSCP